MSGENPVVEAAVVNQLYRVVHELHICVKIVSYSMESIKNEVNATKIGPKINA
jgi:hypothetical protein